MEFTTNNMSYKIVILNKNSIESIKALRFQTPQIRDALLKLGEINDLKIKSEADCLATYELDNF